ncbi:MAG: HAD family phosphatase [Bergeyella sp.]|nr:HAD family phosphatase [Bergeyella sp.]
MVIDKNVLWDLDGTIVRSEDVDFKFAMFEYASNKIGLKFKLSQEDYIGKEAQFVFKKTLITNKSIDVAKYELEYNKWYELSVNYILNNIDFIKERDNVVEVWKDLDNVGIKNSVVTSSREDIAKAYLSKIGLLGFCNSLVSVNHVSNPKPSPEPYLLCVKNLNTSVINCVTVEDSITGIQSSVNACIKTIAWVDDVDKFNNTGASVVTTKINTDLILGLFNS